MMKILITMIFGFVLMVFAQEGAPPQPDGKAVNAESISTKANPDISGDVDYSKSAGLGKKPNATEGTVTDNVTKGCTNCKQPIQGRITSKKGARVKKGSGSKTADPSSSTSAESNQ